MSSCCCCWCLCRLLLAFLLYDSVGPAAVDNPDVKGVPAVLPSLRAFASFTTLANIPAFAGIYTVLAFLLMLSCCCLRSCCFGQSCYCCHPCCRLLLASQLLLDLGCCWRPFSSWWCSVAGLPAIAGIPVVVGISAVAYKHAVAGGPAVAVMKRGHFRNLDIQKWWRSINIRCLGCGTYVRDILLWDVSSRVVSSCGMLCSSPFYQIGSWYEDTYAFSGHVRRSWLFKNLKKLSFFSMWNYFYCATVIIATAFQLLMIQNCVCDYGDPFPYLLPSAHPLAEPTAIGASGSIYAVRSPPPQPPRQLIWGRVGWNWGR